MSRYEVVASAWRDIEDLYVYFAVESPPTAERFLDRCRETFAWLADAPLAGRLWRGRSRTTRGIRVWHVAGFPNHLIFYRARGGAIVILHVLGGARDIGPALSRGAA
ncbi:MAG: type II toxin-antitoxin system RelE/ParE family toxin [Phycisphaerales bacterium]